MDDALPIIQEERITTEVARNLVAKYTLIIVELEELNAKVQRKMGDQILDENEQALIKSFQIIMNIVNNEEEYARNRLAELLEMERTDGEGFSNGKLIYDTITKSLDFVNQRVDPIVKRMNEFTRSNQEIGTLELHQKIHDEIFVPVMKVVQCLEAMSKINEEIGSNNTGPKEVEAIVKDWTRCNIPFGLAEITFYVCALQLEWPNKMWLPDFKHLLRTVDQLKSVNWFYEFVSSMATGDKRTMREYDDEIKGYHQQLRGVIPSFKNTLEALSGLAFED